MSSVPRFLKHVTEHEIMAEREIERERGREEIKGIRELWLHPRDETQSGRTTRVGFTY